MLINYKIEKPDLKIGFIPITCSAPLIYAHSHGIFEKNGLNVEMIKPPGWSGVKELLVYDYIDAAHMLSPMPLACHLGLDGKKSEIKLVTMQNINGQALTLSNRHLGIKSVKDMKGFTFGIPYRFSMHYYLLCYFLAANGLNPLKDVKMEEVSPSLMPYYLKKGKLDGYFTAEPYNQLAVYQKIGFIHTLSKEIWQGHPCCAFAIKQKFIEKYPNTYKIMLKSVLEAEWILHNAKVEERKEIAKEISAPYYINQENYIPVAQALSGDFPDGKGKNHVIPDRIDFAPFPWVEYGIWMLSQMQRWSQLSVKVNYSDIVENVFEIDANRELAKSLGFEIEKKPSLSGIHPFTGEDPLKYVSNQPFSAFKEEEKPLKELDMSESVQNRLSIIIKQIASVAGGDLDQKLKITDSGEIGLLEQILNELVLNMKFMRDILTEKNENIKREIDTTNAVFNTAADGIRIIDKNFNVLRINKTFTELSGLSIDESLRINCFDAIKSPLCHTPECTLVQILGGKDRLELPVEHIRKDGTIIPCIITAQPYRNIDGEIIGIVESLRDMSRIKEIELRTAAIFEASTPVVQVWEGIVVIPIIGTLDSERAQQIMDQLLERVVETHSKVALVDITGVPTVDTAIAQHLIDTFNAVRLLGTHVVLTGIKPSIAQTLVYLGIDLSGIFTCKSLMEGIRLSLSMLDMKIISNNIA